MNAVCNTPASVRALIDLWPTRQALASEIGLPVARVHKWAQTGAIPARMHQAVLVAAASRGFPVDADLIVRLHAPPQEDAA